MFSRQAWLSPPRTPSVGRTEMEGGQSAKRPQECVRVGPARSGRPSGLPGSARRLVAPLARTRSFERRGPARSAPARPDRGKRSHRPASQPSRRTPHLGRRSPRVPLRTPPRPGCDTYPFSVPLRPRCPALPRPAAASAASRDRAAPAAPAVLALLAAWIQAPPYISLDASDWTDQS